MHSDVVLVELINQSQMIVTKKATITILNKNAESLGKLFLYYDKNSTIQNANLEYFDNTGKSIRKLKKSDFSDFASVEDFSLYSDDRVLVYVNSPEKYPYTVKYEYKIISSNTAFLHHWNPMKSFGVAVESSIYSITYPKDLVIQYSKENFLTYNVEVVESTNSIQFQLKNQKSIIREPLCPSFRKLAPWSQLSSNKFELAGVKGVANNWNEYASWMKKNLLDNRNNLPETTKNEVKNLIQSANNPYEKATMIFDYVQNKVRYISVQIGIGGWMPMKTADVDQLGYGDCKALTFYTKSLLDVAGINSQYTLVYADETPIDINENIVCTQGNHAFLLIPFEKDTLFAECTSQKLALGVTGVHTRNRKVLTLNDNGGTIVKTPEISADENLMTTTASVFFNQNGNLNANLSIISKENWYAQRLNQIDALSDSKKDVFYKNQLNHLASITFQNIKTFNNKSSKQYEENLQFTIQYNTVKSEDKSIIFTPNLFSRIQEIPLKTIERTHPFEINDNSTMVDNYTITLPIGYVPQDLPYHFEIDTDFGTYRITASVKDNILNYNRVLSFKSGTYSKDDYDNYRDFLKKIKKTDDYKILINTNL